MLVAESGVSESRSLLDALRNDAEFSLPIHGVHRKRIIENKLIKEIKIHKPCSVVRCAINMTSLSIAGEGETLAEKFTCC